MPYLGLLVTALLVITIVDLARSPEERIHGLPRTQWTLLVVRFRWRVRSLGGSRAARALG